MSTLLRSRLDRLERRERALASSQRYPGRPTLQEHYDALTTIEEREAFLTLVGDVFVIQQREDAAEAAGHAIPARTAAEQAWIDAFTLV